MHTPAPMFPTTIFSPESTPARWVFDLSLLVYGITFAIFALVGGLLVYVIVRFRAKTANKTHESAQIYGSRQIELAWTIVPFLIVLVLFLASARVIASTQRDVQRPGSIEVNVVGHQFWWEYRYPGLDIVTANELHVPTSAPAKSAPTVLHLYSVDVVHSFWIPRLAGKTDVIPNFPNNMWIDPAKPGLYLGQCSQYCGAQHAKMLVRVYVDTPEDFAKWAAAQKQPAHPTDDVRRGRAIFERNACMKCHTVAGTPANGSFGPDLTHLMSRNTLAAGIVENNRENLRAWIKDPSTIKPDALMPAMGFEDGEIDAVTDYLMTLR